MEDAYKHYFDSLTEAEKSWKSADHFVYVILPAVKDNKIIIRAFENIYSSVVLIISNVLKIEYVHKRVNLTKDPKRNLEIFFTKCGNRYGLSEQDIEIIKEILFLGRKHKESGLEFSKSGKVIIVDDNLKTNELSLEKVKVFLKAEKKLLDNANRNFEDFFRKVFKAE